MTFYVNGVKHQAQVIATINNISLLKGEGFYGFFSSITMSVYSICYYSRYSDWTDVLNTWSK